MKPSQLTRPELFACRNLRVGISGRAILPAIELTIKSGQFWAVVGRNGAGKSTTLKAVMGLVAAESGSIGFDGGTIGGAKPFAIAGPKPVPAPGRTFRTAVARGSTASSGRRDSASAQCATRG